VPVLDALDVGRRVHQRQLAVAGRGRLGKAQGRQLGRQTLAQAAVLAHRKAVALGQGQDKVVGVERLHGGVHWSSAHSRKRTLNKRFVGFGPLQGPGITRILPPMLHCNMLFKALQPAGGL